MRQLKYALSAAVLMAVAAGCATSPTGQGAKNDLIVDADAELKRFYETDKTLPEFIKNSAGYAVFPAIGKGGFIIGGSYGRGVVYVDGKPVGYSDVTKVSVGGTAGGEQLSKIFVFTNKTTLLNFIGGEFTLTADASAVAVKDGAAASAVNRGDVVVFVDSKAGAMVDASAGGQQFRFEPMK